MWSTYDVPMKLVASFLQRGTSTIETFAATSTRGRWAASARRRLNFIDLLTEKGQYSNGNAWHTSNARSPGFSILTPRMAFVLISDRQLYR